MHDLQVFIGRVRQVQASLPPPDLSLWRELDALVAAVENSCRRLHARYVRERAPLEAICERVLPKRQSRSSPGEYSPGSGLTAMHGPYELYLIRHGIAEARGEAWPDDTKRPLTEDGMSRLRKAEPRPRAARRRHRHGAHEPARPHASDGGDRRGRIRTAAAPRERRIARARRRARRDPGRLEKHAKKARIAIVGHEPGIGELAARLIGTRHPIPFKKGAVCRIDLDVLPPAGPGELRWFLTPRALRAIKKK